MNEPISPITGAHFYKISVPTPGGGRESVRPDLGNPLHQKILRELERADVAANFPELMSALGQFGIAKNFNK